VGGGQGRAVQVDPIKPTMKSPGINRLKLDYDKLLSNCAFQNHLAPLHQGVEQEARDGGAAAGGGAG